MPLDHIFVINQLIEKATEYNLGLKMMFIDFNKTFDSMKQGYLWRAMNNQVEEWAIGTVKNVYKNSKAYVRLEKKGKSFRLNRA